MKIMLNVAYESIAEWIDTITDENLKTKMYDCLDTVAFDDCSDQDAIETLDRQLKEYFYYDILEIPDDATDWFIKESSNEQDYIVAVINGEAVEYWPEPV